MLTESGRDNDLSAEADEGVIIGYPASRDSLAPLLLGVGARLRSGTVLYDGTVIGRRLQTGHGVVIREACTIGDDVSIWSNSVVDYGCRIGSSAKIHCSCYVAQYTVIEDDVFLAPGVMIANDLYPGNVRSGELMAGPSIGAGAQVGVNVTILPYVRIGPGAVIGAGSVVSRDIPANVVAFGNPARPRKDVADLADIDLRLAANAHSRRRVPWLGISDVTRRQGT